MNDTAISNTSAEAPLQPSVTRIIRVRTQQIILPDKPKVFDLPTRKWRIELFLLDQNREEQPASVFEHVTYHLHPSFESPVKKMTDPPFILNEQGWGEFEMRIVGRLKYLGITYTIRHLLSFDENAYTTDYEARFPIYDEQLRRELAKTGKVSIVKEAELSEEVLQELRKMIKRLPSSEIEDVQNVVSLVTAFPPVVEMIKKGFHKQEEVVVLLSQLPNEILAKMYEMVNDKSLSE